jgi:hypothetical protein
MNKYPELFSSSLSNPPLSDLTMKDDHSPENMNCEETLPSLLATTNESSNMQASPSSVATEANVVPLQLSISSSESTTQPQKSSVDPLQGQSASSTALPFTNTPTQETPPYPPTFAEIVALITSGADIPGIKDIPNVVYPMSMAAKPTAQRRRKPWEKDIPEDTILNGMKEGTFGDQRDHYIVQELPEENTLDDGHSSVVV